MNHFDLMIYLNQYISILIPPIKFISIHSALIKQQNELKVSGHY